VTVDITLTIQKGQRNNKSISRLKQFVLKNISYPLKQGSPIVVDGTTADGVNKKLKLSQHPLTASAPLPDSSEPQQFTQLLETLCDVCSERQDMVYKLVEG
jgi:hypothetical protein